MILANFKFIEGLLVGAVLISFAPAVGRKLKSTFVSLINKLKSKAK